MFTTMTPNMRAIAATIAAMACFTLSDVVIKLTSTALPLGEMIVIRNGIATIGILVYGLFAGGLWLPQNPPIKLLSWRIVGEMGSTLAFLGALVAMPIGDISAIVQFTPLAVTAAAAIFLREPVGIRRWLAALAGFIGVMIIIRPGSSAFTPAAVIAFLSIAFVVLRDVITRLISSEVPTLTLTLMSAAFSGVAGLLLLPFETWVPPGLREITLLTAGALSLTLAYALITIAMRTGELAAASPFRYTQLLFSLIAGYVLWNELPDWVSMSGIVIVVGAGLYTLHREQVRAAEVPNPPRAITSSAS